MPTLKTYDLFISHAWKYGEKYKRIIDFLDASNNFYYRNFSAPKDKPLIPYGMTVPDTVIKEKIYNKIRPANCVLILGGMYSAHSSWIQTEIDIALSLNKPIIGIKPWNQTRMPNAVTNASDEIVGWNTNSIVDAIRRNSI